MYLTAACLTMLSRTILLTAVACLALGCGEKPTAPTPVVLQTVAELAFSNPAQAGPALLAQSITLPPGGAFNHIRFRWTPFPGAPPLTGSVYVIDREYLGPITSVSTAPGLVARSTGIEGGESVFDPAVTLAGGTKYWFASDSSVGFLCSQPTSDVYAGGDLYFTGSLTGGETSYLRAFVYSQTEQLDSSFSLRGARVQ